MSSVYLGKRVPFLLTDAPNANESIKTIPGTVGVDFGFVLESAFITYTTSAAVGNRVVAIDVRDTADDPVARFIAAAQFVDPSTQFFLHGMPGVFPSGALLQNTAAIPIGPTPLLPGWDVRVYPLSGGDTGDRVRVVLFGRGAPKLVAQ